MDKSLVKIKCASPSIKLGDVSYNADLIINEIKEADREGVNVLLLPELCLCGYSLRDMLSSPVIVESTQREIVRIANETATASTVSVVGMPFKHGDKLYNCAVIIEKGVILGAVPKSTLPKKSPFGEIRVFDTPSCDFEIMEAFGTQLGFGTELVIPVFNGSVRIGAVLGNARECIYALVEKGANLILNPTADIVTVTMAQDRSDLAKQISYESGCVFAMCNPSEEESTTDGVFSPHNLICQNGILLCEKKPFDKKTSDPVCEININSTENGEKPSKRAWTNNSPSPFVLDNQGEMDERCDLILNIQANALARRLRATYSKTMVVGISGGLDSTLALLAMVKSADLLNWDRKNIVAITMPCFGTTKRTKSNAIELCDALGVTLREIDILEATRIHLRDIGHDESIRNVTYENAQARERTQILMDVANDTNGIVVGTGDLSEVALGWATYNGDHMAMYNVNSDIPKTLVRHVVGYFAKNSGGRVAEILFDILDTPVSPELLPAKENGEIEQKTEDLVGPYDLHDYFLYNFAGRGYKPSQIYKNALEAFEGKFDSDTVYKWLTVFIKRFVTQQFKRSASPEGIKIGSVSLSPRGDFNMPSDMSYQSFLDELEANK
ncbi:MAG: NAD(+) synthase [Ruminococcaceae bacterium]|nr:NAD(+) synthase [Oscillospiraceae bacterium]